jgi:4-hydroxybenzoate polyprenyltransferase
LTILISCCLLYAVPVAAGFRSVVKPKPRRGAWITVMASTGEQADVIEIEPAGRAAPGVSAARRLRGLGRSMRPRHWIKNLPCFAGLIFSGKLAEGAPAVGRSALAFAGFSLAASSIYLVNDVLDRRFDRLSPTKRHRPIASGVVPVSWALGAAAALCAAAMALTLPLGGRCLAVLGTYTALSVAYSVGLKHAVLIDVFCIALGFVLRVVHGVYAVGVARPTTWIVLCMFFLALFLGFGKRRAELNQAGPVGTGEAGAGQTRRPVLGKYDVEFLDKMLVITATIAILCYALYTAEGRPDNPSLAVTVPLVAYGVFRYMFLVTVRGAGDLPEVQIFADRISLGVIAAWALLCAAVIYGDIHILTTLK